MAKKKSSSRRMTKKKSKRKAAATNKPSGGKKLARNKRAAKVIKDDLFASVPSFVQQFQKRLEKPLSIPELMVCHTDVANARKKFVPESAPEERDELDACSLNVLKTSLQVAIEVEFSTIPPYLCALWSVKNNLHLVAKSIREVVQEEMLHMALACNMLAAIGGKPEIATPQAVPNYPSALPGGVHQGLVVPLSKLDKSSLAGFLEIEQPAKLIDLANVDLKVLVSTKDSSTIGEFYESIKQRFHELRPDMNSDNQITGLLAWTTIGNLHNVDFAIDTISRQGEGADVPYDTNPSDLAHFYRFLAIYLGVELRWDVRTSKLVKSNAPLFDFDDPKTVRQMKSYDPNDNYSDVVKDKHDEEGEGRLEVAKMLMDRFDLAYTKMLHNLQRAWTSGGHEYFICAMRMMFDLEKYSLPLMDLHRNGVDGLTFGPRFRFLEDISSDDICKQRAIR